MMDYASFILSLGILYNLYSEKEYMVMKFRKKPVVIEALPWTGKNMRNMYDFLTNYEHTDDYISDHGDHFEIDWQKNPESGLMIHTLEGDMKASVGDLIIKGVNGEFYPCKPDIFAKTYEEAPESVKTDFEILESSEDSDYIQKIKERIEKEAFDLLVDGVIDSDKKVRSVSIELILELDE